MTQDVNFCSAVGPVAALNSTHVESFLARQRALGYAACKFRDKWLITQYFVTWTQTMEIPATAMTEAHVIAYLELHSQPSKERLAFKRALLLAFLRHLRDEGVAPNMEEPVEETLAKRLEQEYADYLRDERGLSLRSLLVYLPHVRAFLTDYMAETRDHSLNDLDAGMVRTFLLGRFDDLGGESTRLLTIALRSFLHFVFLRGVTQLDLSSAITTIRKPRGAGVHAFLSPAEVEKVVSAPDLRTPVGRRDHAILLLLARLGLRAGEVVTLGLDDICWRTGEIVVHGKGGTCNRLPLLKDIGTALAQYIQSGRGDCDCRRVFLRRFAPRIGFSGPAAVGHVVRRHMARAGVQRPSRAAAHLFRHSLATGMLHNGASLSEISEVLRHHCVATTEIYAKVAFESLREVARPWPGEEVVR